MLPTFFETEFGEELENSPKIFDMAATKKPAEQVEADDGQQEGAVIGINFGNSNTSIAIITNVGIGVELLEPN